MGVQSLTPVLNVSNVGESFAWFEALGWRRGFSWNDGGLIGDGQNAAGANEHGAAGFGSVCSGEAKIFLCCGGQGSRGTIMPKFPGDLDRTLHGLVASPRIPPAGPQTVTDPARPPLIL